MYVDEYRQIIFLCVGVSESISRECHPLGRFSNINTDETKLGDYVRTSTFNASAELESPYCISGEHANFFGEINILCEGKWRRVGGTGQIGVVEAEYLAGFCN